MEIFKYRHFALGLGAFLVSLYISYYLSTAIKIVLLVASLLAFTTLILVFIFKKHKGTPDNFIRCAFLCAFIALAMIVSLISFQNEKSAIKYCDENEHIVYGEIVETKYEKSFENAYIIETEKIDDDSLKTKAILLCYGENLKIGDKVEASAKITMLENTSLSNQRSYYLDDGIFLEITMSECIVTKEGDNKPSAFVRLNEFLSLRFYKYLNEETASLFSALLLGNDEDLDGSVRRDFSRVGISHVLALSGLHITILTILLGFALRLLKLPIVVKNIILILFTGFFVALTGFSDSAMRAGIMACIVCVLSLIGFSVDSITSLFLSVSIICIIYPYSIFSVSLWLSFFAMLGCLIGGKFIRHLGLSFKSRVLKYVVYSFITSMFVFGFTLPMVMMSFGQVSILSVLANILIVPIFTVIIYFTPLALATLGIPYLTVIIEWIAQTITHLVMSIVRYIASFEGIVIPISNEIQRIAVIAIIVFLVLLMLVKRKRILIAVLGVFIGGVSFFIGSFANYIDRYTGAYVSISSYKENDFIYLENENDLTIIDISSTSTGNYSALDYAISELNYSEIENYIICDYSHLTNKYFTKVAKNYKLKNVYIPHPTDEAEAEVYNEIENIAENEKINVKFLEKSLYVSNFEIEFAENDKLSRSEKRSVSVDIKAKGCELLYLGASSFEIFDCFTENKAATADIIIFGAYGPNYKIKYNYDMPYLEKAIFSGKSYEWAGNGTLEQTNEKALYSKIEPVRLRLEE